MIVRRLSVLAALVSVGLLVSGCGGEPAPAESTPLFANEDEAFAAAEQTYRDYVDALNAEADGDTASDPTTFLVGEALQTELDSRRELEANDQQIAGHLTIDSFRTFSQTNGDRVETDVCLDVSQTRIIDTNGTDLTPATRPDRVGVRVSLVPIDRVLRIEQISGSEGEEPC